MPSVIQSHFPEFRLTSEREGRVADVFEDSETAWQGPPALKKWYNPVTQSLVSDRPEERVRLRMTDCLIHSFGIPAARISTELPVRIFPGETARRADILCHDSRHRPLLLIECKEERVKIREYAAEQIARYNDRIGARFLMITNGVSDLIFEVLDNRGIRKLASLTEVFGVRPEEGTNEPTAGESGPPPKTGPSNLTDSPHADTSTSRPYASENPVSGRSTLAYWERRGFINSSDIHLSNLPAGNAEPFWCQWLQQFFEHSPGATAVQYLSFALNSLQLSHFFKVFPADSSGRRVALTLARIPLAQTENLSGFDEIDRTTTTHCTALLALVAQPGGDVQPFAAPVRFRGKTFTASGLHHTPGGVDIETPAADYALLNDFLMSMQASQSGQAASGQNPNTRTKE